MKYNYKDLLIWNSLYLNPDLHKLTFKEIVNEISKLTSLSPLYIKFKLLFFRLKGILIKVNSSSYILGSNIFPPISDNIMSYLITTTNILVIDIYLYLANKYINNKTNYTDFELITKALKLPINKRSYELVTNITSSLQNQGLLTIKSTPDHIFTINLWNDEVIIK